MSDRQNKISTAPSVEYPLPPLLTPKANGRQPPATLRNIAGPILAPFIHNYRQSGSIYRYLDIYGHSKVKTVLSGVEANIFVMHHAQKYLIARTFRQKQTTELGSDKYIVAMDGQEHYHMRKLQKRGYARSNLNNEPEAIMEIVEQALANHSSDKPLFAYQFFQKVGIIQLSKTILNHDVDIAHKWQHIATFVDGMLETSFAPCPLSDERLAVYQEAKATTMRRADEIINAHQTNASANSSPDIVDDLLTAVAQDTSFLNEQDLRIAVLTPYIAGINPVAHTCSCLLYALLTHPHLLESVVTEINTCFAQDGFSLKATKKMEKLRYSILEALRLYPFAPVLEMTAAQAFVFNGYQVKPGTAVVLATTVPHFLEELYADPFAFDIERYQTEQAAYRQPGAYTPYGVGPHICLGAGFAEDLMLLIMATLLHNRSAKLASDTTKPIVGIPTTNNFAVYIE